MNIIEKVLHFKFRGNSTLIALDSHIIDKLYDNGISHLGHLLHLTNKDFFRFRNFGKKTIDKLEDFLIKIGFDRELDIYDWDYDESYEQEAYLIIKNVIEGNHKLSKVDIDILENKKIEQIDFDNNLKKEKFLKEFDYKKLAEELKNCFSKDDVMSRNGKIFINRYLNNFTLQKIGDDHGLSRERVRQIIEKSRRKFKSYSFHRGLFLKEFLLSKKHYIWEILTKDKKNKQKIYLSELQKSLYEYSPKNIYGLLDILILIYFGNLNNFIINIYYLDGEQIIFE